MASLALPFSSMKKTSTVASALAACRVTKSGSPAPMPMMSSFFMSQLKQNPLDKPNRAHHRDQDRQNLRQPREPARPGKPDQRRHDDRDEGELAELDTEIKADQRPHHRLARQAEL